MILRVCLTLAGCGLQINYIWSPRSIYFSPVSSLLQIELLYFNIILNQSYLIVATTMNRLTILALTLASANATGLLKRQDSDADLSSEIDDYLEEVCEPADESGMRDWSAPCNAVISIQYECMYGAAGAKLIREPASETDDQTGDDDDGPPEQPNDAQRVCFCQSQFADQIAGCMKCHEAHGGVEGSDWFSGDLIDPAVKQYCNASKPADQSFASFFFDLVSPENGTTTDSPAASTSAFLDPIGNKTDVSLYFTPSVTGT